MKAHKQAEELESLDPALVEPGRTRYQRTRPGIADDGRGIKSTITLTKGDKTIFTTEFC